MLAFTTKRGSPATTLRAATVRISRRLLASTPCDARMAMQKSSLLPAASPHLGVPVGLARMVASSLWVTLRWPRAGRAATLVRLKQPRTRLAATEQAGTEAVHAVSWSVALDRKDAGGSKDDAAA
jgi:hypothetical protein